MVLTLRHLLTLAKITMLEGARKQVFHVLMLFAMTLLTVSTLLGFLDHNVQIKIIQDLCCVAILVSGSLIAMTLGVAGIPGEVEQRTAYPVLAKPIKRWEFVFGKYLGIMGTVGIGMLIMTVAFVAILLTYTGHVDKGVLIVIPYLFLEAAIVGGIALTLSTVCSPPLAWFLTLFATTIGTFKFQLYSFVTSHDRSFVGRALIGLFYQALPNLECFNFKDALVHQRYVPEVYLLQTALYGLLYTAALLTLASISFARKEL